MPDLVRWSSDEGLVTWSRDLARQLLPRASDRSRHVQAVALRAEQAATTVATPDRPILVAAAWLHDIGYAQTVKVTGFHPLDGARFLESIGTPVRLVNLVANHSCAQFEADQRNLRAQLDAYERERGPVADALIYADMTTGPAGNAVSVEHRLVEILRRYNEEDPVHRAIAEASGEIKAAVSRVEERLAELL